MKVRILDAASRDLIEGYHFYEKQQAGLGAYFIDSLFSDIDALLLYAGIHAVHFGRFHRALSKRFPFAIYYKVAGLEVQVYAVLDCRRNPAWIRSHLGAAE
jgi:plasmid stabilization system protein ParE